MAWNEDTLLQFMQTFPKYFGLDIKGIKSASIEWVCKRFTNRLIKLLDWTQAVDLTYVDVEYEGKGDIKSIKAKADFCLTPKKCVTIANFIAGRMPESSNEYLSDLVSFAIIQYINKDIPIYTNWISLLYKIVDEEVK